MHKCTICANEYKNSRSLASHAYICRKKTSDGKSIALKLLKGGALEVTPIAEPVVTQKTSHQADSNSDKSSEHDSYNVEDNRKSEPNGDNWMQKDERECRSDIQASLAVLAKSSPVISRKYTTKIKNLADQTKLLKMLCKSILNGTIPLEPHYVSVLKPHKIIVRKIAYNTMKEARKVIQKGGRSLQTVLETVVSILVSILF